MKYYFISLDQAVIVEVNSESTRGYNATILKYAKVRMICFT